MQMQERRRAPRFDVSLIATACGEQQYCCQMLIINLSQTGLRFVLSQADVSHMMPMGSLDNTNNPQIITVCIDFKVQVEPLENFKPVELMAEIIYIQRNSADQCVVGCQFQRFNHGADQLEAYLTQFGIQSSDTS